MKKIDFKKLGIEFLIVFAVILIFTIIDFFTHLLKAEYAVPSYYFRNKVIFGTIIGFITYMFAKKKKLLAKALIFSGAVSVLLQIRYAIEGYSWDFVLEFLAFHFLMLVAASLIVFSITKKIIKTEERLK